MEWECVDFLDLMEASVGLVEAAVDSSWRETNSSSAASMPKGSLSTGNLRLGLVSEAIE